MRLTFVGRVPLQVVLSLAVVAVTLLLYLLTLAPDVSWGDSPELVLAVQSLGVPHPTGYPFYVLAGKAFSLLIPSGSLVVELNLFSGVCASLAAGCWYLVVWYWLCLGGVGTGAWLFPVGLALGVPFPTAIRSLQNETPALVPWAWSINACASVLATLAVVLISMQAGFRVTLLLTAALYGLGYLIWRPTVTSFANGKGLAAEADAVGAEAK